MSAVSIQPGGGIEIDATVLAEAFELPVADVPRLLREQAITSRLDRGEGEDAGTFRLVFFHQAVRLTLIVDESGTVLRRSRLDYGTHPLPASAHKPQP
ncbi:DUF6522 family protein [Consotaella salsifontis]|uniref:Uncharacterized protein n=1 Tax=Consotaella salsifontis TaxID=1365950 RepID=A0A1T4NIM7_9HYPH|nr:DUF6522 family protein [Consotaella salsifontis]SJZ79109.1 hypothetical protein SAMN05428963_10346 [Consotaella salsifontis]